MPALEVRSLTGPAGRTVIRDIDLAVNRGATHVMLGPIQGGKSMVMRHVLGLERASEGMICIDGEEFDAISVSESVLRRMRTRIGAVFEGSALLSRLSAVENVELPLLEHTEATAEDARETAQEIGGHFVKVNVSDEAQVLAGLDEAEAKNGVARILGN